MTAPPARDPAPEPSARESPRLAGERARLGRFDAERRSGDAPTAGDTREERKREHGKTPTSVPRVVPLTSDVLAALEALPPRLDTPLLFPGIRRGHLDYNGWRRERWTPAVAAAGLDHRTPYALRHTFISNMLAAGVPTFEVARIAGTSVAMIEATYGHLVPDAVERARAALEAFNNRGRTAAAAETER